MITPQNPEVIYQLGQVHHAAGQTDEALTRYRAVIELRPEHGQAYFRMGQILGLEDRLDPALQAFAAAARLMPRDARAQHELGTAYYKTGRIREARVQYLRTLEIDANYLAGYRSLAIVESMLDHSAAAETAYQAFVKRTPGDVEQHRDLAARVMDVAGDAREDQSADAPR